MALVTSEALAGLRLLVGIAKADGVLKSEERFALEDALAGLTLPAGLTLESLLAENNDPKTVAAQISSRDGRDYTYTAVFSLAYCDLELAGPEEKILDALREAWNISKDEDKQLIEVLERNRNAGPGSSTHIIPAIAPEERDAELSRIITRYCILTSITGAIPVPFFPDLAIVPMQVKLVYDIAGAFGRSTDKATVQLLFETLGVGTGVRIGVSALAKLVPGWGSVVGASTAYATTYGLGKAATKFFRDGAQASMESLKSVFAEEKKAGKAEYLKHKDVLDEAQKTHEGKLKELAYSLQQGTITQKEYEAQVDALK